MCDVTLQVRVHSIQGDSTPEGVPNATVSGGTTAETLYNIAVKERLFLLHLGVVEVDQSVFWGDPDADLQKSLQTAKTRLSHHFQTIGELLMAVDPEFTSPTTPATPELPHNSTAFDKKLYGWGVLSNLKDLAHNGIQYLADDLIC